MRTVDHLLHELQALGISHASVLAAIKHVPREAFVEAQDKERAYENHPLPIGCWQTISQPTVVAQMTSLLMGDKSHLNKVLEVGTGSGYQAAILAQVADKVYSLERIEVLYHSASSKLTRLGIENVYLKLADGSEGWQQHAPYDGIIITAGCQLIAPEWLSQLKENCCLVLPLEVDSQQYLCRITRHKDSFQKEVFEPVIFVPLLRGVE